MTDPTERNEADVAGLVEREWRCFQCDELFTDERSAREHFGREEGATPACILKGAEGGLMKALRQAEEQADDAIQMMHAESTDAARAYHAQRCRHSQALIDAEQLGYDRGLADGRTEAAATLTTYAARIAELEAEVAARDEALAPSGDTKAAYMGEFKFDVMVPDIDEDNDELVPMQVYVPWTTIKEIMAAIRARAFLARNTDGGGK